MAHYSNSRMFSLVKSTQEMSGWPSGLRRCVKAAVFGRGFKSHFGQPKNTFFFARLRNDLLSGGFRAPFFFIGRTRAVLELYHKKTAERAQPRASTILGAQKPIPKNFYPADKTHVLRNLPTVGCTFSPGRSRRAQAKERGGSFRCSAMAGGDGA